MTREANWNLDGHTSCHVRIDTSTLLYLTLIHQAAYLNSRLRLQ